MKKYVANWEGKEMILTKRDHKKLLKRFEIKNFKLTTMGYYENEVTCPLCEKFIDNQCSGCTFNKYVGRHNFGCFGILKQISEEIKVSKQHLNLCVNNINFSSRYFDEVSKFIIHVKGLLSTEFQLMVRKK